MIIVQKQVLANTPVFGTDDMHMRLLAGKGVEATGKDVFGVSITPCEVETLLSRMILKDELVTED